MIVFGLNCASRFHQSVDLTPACSLRRLFRGEMLDGQRRMVRDNDNLFAIQKLGACSCERNVQEQALTFLLALVDEMEQRVKEVSQADIGRWLQWMQSSIPTIAQRMPILLAGLVWSPSNKSRLLQTRATKELLSACRSASLRKQLNAAIALVTIMRDGAGRDAVVQAGGISVLTSLASSPDSRVQQVAAIGLARVVHDTISARGLIAEMETVGALYALQRSADPVCKAAAAYVIAELCFDTRFRANAVTPRTVRSLVAAGLSTNIPLKCIGVHAIHRLLTLDPSLRALLHVACEGVAWSTPELVSDERTLRALDELAAVCSASQ